MQTHRKPKKNQKDATVKDRGQDSQGQKTRQSKTENTTVKEGIRENERERERGSEWNHGGVTSKCSDRHFYGAIHLLSDPAVNAGRSTAAPWPHHGRHHGRHHNKTRR